MQVTCLRSQHRLLPGQHEKVTWSCLLYTARARLEVTGVGLSGERLLSAEEIASLSAAEEPSAAPAPPDPVWREVLPGEEPPPLAPEEAGWPHEWHTLCWLLASGLSQRAAAAEMGYTESRISIICSQPAIAAKTERIKAEHYGNNIAKGVARVAPKALDFMERVVTGEEGSASVGNRLHAAQWILEKHSGKPKQEVTVDGALGIAEVLTALDALRGATSGGAGASNLAVLDVTPAAADPIDAWVSAHVPSLGSEKAE